MSTSVNMRDTLIETCFETCYNEIIDKAFTIISSNYNISKEDLYKTYNEQISNNSTHNECNVNNDNNDNNELEPEEFVEETHNISIPLQPPHVEPKKMTKSGKAAVKRLAEKEAAKAAAKAEKEAAKAEKVAAKAEKEAAKAVAKAEKEAAKAAAKVAKEKKKPTKKTKKNGVSDEALSTAVQNGNVNEYVDELTQIDCEDNNTEDNNTEDNISVERFTIDTMVYLKDDNHNIYDINTQDKIGIWNPQTKSLTITE
jgi:hypothetical protein